MKIETNNAFIALQILGLEEQIEGLKIIHVAGTKGKVLFHLYYFMVDSY